jgi:hypothetical protein
MSRLICRPGNFLGVAFESAPTYSQRAPGKLDQLG